MQAAFLLQVISSLLFRLFLTELTRPEKAVLAFLPRSTALALHEEEDSSGCGETGGEAVISDG